MLTYNVEGGFDMTIGPELAFVKILAKTIRSRFPASWLDEIILDLEEVTHAPTYYYSRIKHFREKWKEMKESMNLSGESEDIKNIFQDAAIEYESYGYNLKSLYHMPDSFKDFGISDWDSLALAGQKYAESFTETDINDTNNDLEDYEDTSSDPYDESEIDWPDDSAPLEDFWEMIKEFFT